MLTLHAMCTFQLEKYMFDGPFQAGLCGFEKGRQNIKYIC